MGALPHFSQVGMEVQVPSGFTSAWKQEGQSSDTGMGESHIRQGQCLACDTR